VISRLRAAESPREVRRAYVAALAERLVLSPSVLTQRGGLARALRRAGVTREVAAEAESLFASLDAAAYASGVAAPPDAAARALSIYARVDGEARDRASLANRLLPAVALGALLGGLGVTSLAAAAPTPLATTTERFAAGVRAYDARHFREALQHFAEVTRDYPDAPDAWANFGTAGWAAGDTAAAAVGWQRALRLEPLAADARERLQLISAPQDGPIAGVPPVPLSPVSALALVAWLAGWTLVALQLRGRAIRWAPARWGALAAAAAFGAAAYYAAYVRGAEDRAVVGDRGAARALPALVAEPNAPLAPGDVARTLEQRGAWTRVRLSGGREGWVETDRLIPLGASRS
jgi:ABC-type amino acid transport system permease subunit